jgi:hypothetical protein
MADLSEGLTVTDHCMRVARFRGRPSVSTRGAQKFDKQRFALRKLSDADVEEQYQAKISDRCVAVETFADNDLGKIQESISEFQPKKAWVIIS